MEIWGLIAAVSLGKLVSFCGVAAAIGGAFVGLIFRGAAVAWREERDAAVGKADRLEEKVSDQDATIAAQATQISTLEGKVEVLEKRTDYEVYAERSGREHAQIIDAVAALTRGLHANTTAVEFLIKQVFPAAALPVPQADQQI